MGIVIKTEKSLGHDFKERTCVKESKNNFRRYCVPATQRLGLNFHGWILRSQEEIKDG